MLTPRAVGSAAPTVTLWVLPAVMDMLSLVVAAVLVAVKLTGLGVVPVEVAPTLYVPAWVSAVKVSELARPVALVVLVHEATGVPPVARQVPPLVVAKKVPLAPVAAGAVKVTVAPETGLP